MNSSLLNPAGWSAAGLPTVVGGFNQVIVNTTNAATFFRLIK
jgi:hypothetical protein